MKHISGVRILISAVLLLAGCNRQETETPGFQSNSLSVVESDSLYEIPIEVGKEETVRQLRLELSGTAGLDADFVISNGTTFKKQGELTLVPTLDSNTATSEVAITVLPGQSSVSVPIRLVDDPFVEPTDETIVLTMIDASTGLASRENTFLLAVHDNDSPPTAALQVDLSWNFSEGGSINQADFNLWLVNGLQFSGTTVMSHQLVDDIESANAFGYESIQIPQSLPDDQYYLLLEYVSGTSDVTIELMMSKDRSYQRSRGTVLASQAGRKFYYGPITKQGTKFYSSQRWYASAQ